MLYNIKICTSPPEFLLFPRLLLSLMLQNDDDLPPVIAVQIIFLQVLAVSNEMPHFAKFNLLMKIY